MRNRKIENVSNHLLQIYIQIKNSDDCYIDDDLDYFEILKICEEKDMIYNLNNKYFFCFSKFIDKNNIEYIKMMFLIKLPAFKSTSTKISNDIIDLIRCIETTFFPLHNLYFEKKNYNKYDQPIGILTIIKKNEEDQML